MKFSFRHILLVCSIILALVTVHYYFIEYRPAVEESEIPSPETFMPFEYYVNYRG